MCASLSHYTLVVALESSYDCARPVSLGHALSQSSEVSTYPLLGIKARRDLTISVEQHLLFSKYNLNFTKNTFSQLLFF